MPPRTVKRGSASAGAKRGGRTTRGTPKKQDQPAEREVVEETAKVEEVSVVEVETKELREEVAVQEKSPVVEDKPVIQNKPVVVEEKQPIAVDVGEVESSREVRSDSKQSVPPKKEEEVKDEEYGKDERLDLEDNDPESEPDEDGGFEYDEKEIEQEDVQEVVDGEGEPEDNVGDEEGDMVEEDVEDAQEDLEGEDDDQQGGEDHEHAGMVDADEDEHHEVVKERRKRKEFEVFVGGLDKDVKEEDLKKVFSAVGEVTEVRLMMNPQTKKNKGFAFLRFATVEEAKRAVSELKNPVINGKQCGVTPSQDSDTLFLGNICKTWKKDALKEKLKHYGVDNVEDLTLVEDSNNEGSNRGFAFLEFSSRSDAMDAFKRLQKRDVVFGVDRPAKVSFADSFIDPGDEIMAQVKTVFVDSLPASWDEEFVRGLLKKYGEIEKIELARNMPSAKRKDFGFVTFDTHDAAVSCAKSINNSELGEGDNKAKVRARLSRPLQRGKGKHASRTDYWPGRTTGRVRGSWTRPAPRSIPIRGVRGVGSHLPPVSVKRPSGVRDRRPVIAVPPRGRPVAAVARSYDRGPPVASYSKSSLKRDYGRREELHPSRSRMLVDYASRVVPERNPSYRDDYASRAAAFSDPPRRDAPRRAYVDDGYSRRFERPPPPSYRDVRARDYDALIGSKRPYSSMSDVPPAYADTGVRQSRSRLDYDYGAGASQYGDAYDSRIGRSNIGGYDSRSSISGSFSSDVGGMYSSSYGGDYMTRGSNVGGSSSYSSMYPGRSVGGSSYMGSGGSGSYY
ncbi:nucleolin [Cucumis sativus]|uniref:RRM domain-containing protein n=1 Tax=Cucumis sativus TaxID=3659 RepID=A0A0A0L6P0_CUCSA|nr:nucleolin [Cucumis sativus]KGN56704.1 hypothetical protein Csa_010835 [Cucumis sativus]